MHRILLTQAQVCLSSKVMCTTCECGSCTFPGINKSTVQRIRSSSFRDNGDEFFVKVCCGDVEGVRAFLKREHEEAESLKSQLCHPLCSCPTCAKLQDKWVI